MKTYNDLDEKEQNKLDGIVEAYNENKIDDLYSGAKQHEEYGLCSSCSYFQIAESEFKVLLAKCKVFAVHLSTVQPVKRCSVYSKRGTMSLWDMKDIAILIDPTRRKAGFIINNKEEGDNHSS